MLTLILLRFATSARLTIHGIYACLVRTLARIVRYVQPHFRTGWPRVKLEKYKSSSL
jgi:hypothetical protein